MLTRILKGISQRTLPTLAIASRNECNLAKRAFGSRAFPPDDAPIVLNKGSSSSSSGVTSKDLNDLNDFYSDLFTPKEPRDLNKKHASSETDSELDELNREMADLYGVDVMVDQIDGAMTPKIKDTSSPTASSKETAKGSRFASRTDDGVHEIREPLGTFTLEEINNFNTEMGWNTEDQPVSILDRLESSKPLIIKSISQNPFFNLALEERIFELTPKPSTTASSTIPIPARRLMLYTNTPSVIIGKNQNPHKEVSVPLLNSLGIPLLRRFSGGGTVVHDLGNVNYSFMTGREEFARGLFNGCIVKEVNSYFDKFRLSGEAGELNDSDGIQFTKRYMEVNERGDVVLFESEMGKEGLERTPYKISGSAYKISKGKSYHHGTMLLDSNLKVLRDLLSKHPNVVSVKDTSVNSIRSEVKNVGLKKERFEDLVCQAFEKLVLEKSGASRTDSIDVVELDESSIEELGLKDKIDQLKSWDWSMGNTPGFEITYQYPGTNDNDPVQIMFKVKRNHIVDTFEIKIPKAENPEEVLKHWNKVFQMLRFALEGGNEIQFRGDLVSGFIIDDEISEWIAKTIDGTEI